MATDHSEKDGVLDLRNHEAALALLRSKLSASDGAPQLRALLADGLVPANLSEWEDDEVLDFLAHRLAAGDLTPSVRERVYRSAEQIVMPERTQSEPVLAVPVETTWVEFQLVDELGDPVSNAPFEITLPGDTVRRGTTNTRGRARFDDLVQAGECIIKFTDLDSEAWTGI